MDINGNQRIMSGERGAKVYLKESINNRSSSIGLEKVLSIILGLENNKSRWQSVANSGAKFHELGALTNIKVAINSKTFERNFKDNLLTHTTLGAIICYVFEKFNTPQIINNKLYQLFSFIEINGSAIYNASINTLIKYHINQLKGKDQKKSRNDKNYIRKYPEDWKFEIDINWKPILSIFPTINNQEEVTNFIETVYTLDLDDDPKSSRLTRKNKLFHFLKKPIISLPLIVIITILCTMYFLYKDSENTEETMNDIEEKTNSIFVWETEVKSEKIDTTPVKIHTEYNGIKNEFNGNVENVNFIEKKEKIEL